jgi:hypothetical protein
MGLAAMNAARAILLVEEELSRAQAQHGPMSSPHEGYAVILEELDELWTEIRSKRRNNANMEYEATQVAAMAVRFLIDLL